MTAAFLDLDGVPDAELLDDLKAMICSASDNAPRSQQRALGPSEVGHPCLRRLAHGLMGEQRINPSGDPLPSIVGTATHTWLETAANQENERLGETRWYTERRVTIRDGLTGTCDLYDAHTRTVIDWKLPGTTAMSKYRKHGPTDTYRAQAHLYGRGYLNAGFAVDRVGICFLPRGGQLTGAHLWAEDYDDAVVDAVLDRIDTATLLAHDLNVEAIPEHYNLIPTSPGTDCMWCPAWSPDPQLPTACGGNTAR